MAYSNRSVIHHIVCSSFAISWLAVSAGCAPAPAPDTRVADEAALRAADAAFSKASESRSLDRIAAYFADDATLLPPNSPMLSSHDAIRKMFGDMLAMPGFLLTWQATKVEVAKSGDVGFSLGTFTMAMTGPDGKPAADHGKYATVWRKQADGNWKVIVDMFNSDTPAPPPPAAPKK